MTQENNQPLSTEDQKAVAEYLEDLNSPEIEKILAIEPESNPQSTQRMEAIVEEPVRNKKEKPKPVQQQVPIPQPPIQKPVEPEVTNLVEITVAEVKPEEPKPKEQPTPQPPQQEAPPPQALPPQQPQRPAVNSLDDYIQMNAERVRQQYYQAGDIASQEYLQSTYDKFLAIADGRIQVVPIQQEQTQQAPEPEKESDIETLRKIEFALKTDLTPQDRKGLLKLKADLLGFPFDEREALLSASPTPAPVMEPVQASPVDSKKVNTEQPKKKPSRLSPKLLFAGLGLATLVTVAIILLIAALTHSIN